MSKDITYVPPDYIAKHTKTNNIISCDEEGNIVFDIETEYIPLIRCKECTHLEATDSNGTELYIFQLEDKFISVPKEQLEFKPLSLEELKEMKMEEDNEQ